MKGFKFYFMRTLAIVLIVVGAVMTVFTGFNLVTKKKVADIGPIQIDKTEKTPIYWSPITGGILLVAGVVLMVSSKKTST
jgi:drug/metabolite transporter (DMT)-like permease